MTSTLIQTILPRGGIVVDTELGPIQVGMPPETIKDSMTLGRTVPEYFIIPSSPFTKEIGPTMGINVAEFEFPAYCNFFFKGKSVTLVVQSKAMEDRIRCVFQETLFGPQAIDIAQDFIPGTKEEDMPMLEKELGHFRRFGETLMNIDMLLKFVHFSEGGIAVLNDTPEKQVIIEHTRDNCFLIKDSIGHVVIPDEVILPIPRHIPTAEAPFSPPAFGVTVLGNSHGFDPSGNTSGYVLWINHRGIMIDPPPYSSAILAANGIPPVLIDGVIVSHCHADHDAGTFQKILQESKVTLITTPTIYQSFIRKYSALSGLDASFLENVLEFRPIAVNCEHRIRGAVFKFFYSLHTIPCIGFTVKYGSKSIAFSGDHLNDGATIEQLYQKELLTKSRRDQLLNFPWHCDLILHEAGVPPIHTPIKTLTELSDDVKAKLYVVHTAAKDIPENVGLRGAPEGVKNTLVVDCDVEIPHADALEILDLVRKIDILSSLTLENAYELLQMVQRRKYPAGSVVVKEGTIGDSFYVIVCGEADVLVPYSPTKHANTNKSARHAVLKRYIAGDYFGEAALMTAGGLRTADIVASSDLDVLEFDATDFRWLLHNTDAPRRISMLMESRRNFVWDTIMANKVFATLSSFQKTQLELTLEKVEVASGTQLWKVGELATMAFFVESGEFIYQPDPPRKSIQARRRSMNSVMPLTSSINELKFKTGTFVGEVDVLMMKKECLAETTCVALTKGTYLKLEKKALQRFLSQNPGILMAISGSVFVL